MCTWSCSGIIGKNFSNQDLQYVLLFVNLWVLTPIVVISGLMATLSYHYYEKYIKPR
jgi:hypothetical protein